MATVSTVDVLLRANTATYRQAMLDAGRVTSQQLGRIQQEAEKTAKVMGRMQGVVAAAFSAQAARAGITALLDTAKSQQALVNSMRASVATSAQAADALSFVSQTAKELGLNFQSAAEGFQRMTASASANGIAMEDQKKLFLEVSRAATSLHLAPEQVDRAMTALSQSFSKGRFQAEELRQQLAEAIPGVVPRFQQAVMEMTRGTSLAGKSFDQLLQGGLLDVKTFLPAMISSFADMGRNWSDAASSMQSEANRLGNAWRDMKVNLSEGAFSDVAVAGIRGATAALEGMGAVLPVLVPAMTSLAAVKLGKRAADWVKGLNAGHAAMLAQAVGAEQAAAALVQKTRAEMEDAQASANRARAAYGGSIAADLAATTATNAHKQALLAHEAATTAVTAASSRLALAGKAVLGFFGGPVGLVSMVGLTAAQWLLFRDNTNGAAQALVDWSQSADAAIGKYKELNALQQASSINTLRNTIKDQAKQFESDMASISNSVSQLFAQGYDRSMGAYDLYPASAKAAAQQYLETHKLLTEQFNAGKLKADEFSASLATAQQELLQDETAARMLKDQLLAKAGVVGTLTRDLQHNQAQLETLTGKQDSAATAANSHAAALRGLSGAAQSATAQMSGLFGSFSDQVWQAQIEWIRKTKGDLAAFRAMEGKKILDKGGVDKLSPDERSAYNATDAFMAKHYARMKAYDEQQKAIKATARAHADAGQDMLRSAEARQKEYELEIVAGDSLSASRRELLKFDLLLRDTSDKTVKTKADEIRKTLEQNVALEDQIDAQRRLSEAKLRAMAVDRQILDYMGSMQRKHERDLQGIKHGGNTAAWNSIKGGIGDEFRQQRQGLDDELRNRLATIPLEQMKRRNEEQQRYTELIGKTVIAESAALTQARKNFEEMLAAQSSWTNGARAALEDYIAHAQDVAGQTREIMGGALTGLEDLFTDFFTKGSADWKAYFDDIANQITRFIIRQQIMKLAMKFMPGLDEATGDQASALSGAAGKLAASAAPLMAAAAALSASAGALAAAGLAGGAGGGSSGAGGFFGSLFGGGGGAGGGGFMDIFKKGIGSLFGFEGGGYTGPGGRYQPAGIVHRGEGVLSQPEIRAIGGEAGFNALRRAIRSGYADGGFVGGSRLIETQGQSESHLPGRLRKQGGGSGFVQNITNNFSEKTDRRTRSQIESAMWKAGWNASRRLG